MSILDDIGTALTDAGLVGGATGWTLAKSHTPPTPDQVVTILDTGGNPPDNVTGTSHNYVTFQIQVRAAKFKYDDARAKADAIFTALHAVDLSGYIYVHARNSGAIPIGFDGSDRPEIAINFETMEER